LIRFRFELRPLAEVAPWGRDKPNLHWFGLTDGWYWIEIGNVCLLKFAADYEIPYVDYYVVRLWEDLLQLLPAALEEVPADLVGFLESDDRDWNEAESEAVDAAMDCWSSRDVCFGYLREPPSLRCWRTADQITINWNAPANFAEPRALRTTQRRADDRYGSPRHRSRGVPATRHSPGPHPPAQRTRRARHLADPRSFEPPADGLVRRTNRRRTTDAATEDAG